VVRGDEVGPHLQERVERVFAGTHKTLFEEDGI
jgi:hypothetical protein